MDTCILWEIRSRSVEQIVNHLPSKEGLSLPRWGSRCVCEEESPSCPGWHTFLPKRAEEVPRRHKPQIPAGTNPNLTPWILGICLTFWDSWWVRTSGWHLASLSKCGMAGCSRAAPSSLVASADTTLSQDTAGASQNLQLLNTVRNWFRVLFVPNFVGVLQLP